MIRAQDPGYSMLATKRHWHCERVEDIICIVPCSTIRVASLRYSNSYCTVLYIYSTVLYCTPQCSDFKKIQERRLVNDWQTCFQSLLRLAFLLPLQALDYRLTLDALDI
jgi:hypothetical protein